MPEEEPHSEDDQPTIDPTVAPGSIPWAESNVLPGYAAGDVIGSFKIMELIGEGGFGVVYLAEQSHPVKRRVALKVIKPGMDTKGVIARFQVERQALAMMSHPGIARIYEAGTTTDQRPWFAMEYVKGVPITEYCDTHRLSTVQRLDLFAHVCNAIQHAHQKGIIHRDLKPGNVLVSVVDEGTPSVKVIDFGIAKATSQQLTEATVFTQQGQFIGTPDYMSPEQAEMSSLDIDTRSDVYALGVILYELLTGRLPFDPVQLREAGLIEILRVIREDDPPRPSTRLSSLQGDAATTVSKAHRTRLGELASELRRELEWIPLKALRKDRTERYDSASAMADDVRRYLAGEPLVAGPETASYLLRKFLRRNRGPVIAAALLLLVLITGVVASTLFALESSRQRTLADEQRRIAEDRTAEAEHEAARARTAENRAESEAQKAVQQAYLGRIHAAQAALKENNTSILWKHLDEIEILRDGEPTLEEAYLRGRVDGASRVIEGHEKHITSLAFSPDGQTLISGSLDGTVRTWDVATGQHRLNLAGHKGHVYMVFMDPDNGNIISYGSDDHMVVWDSVTGTQVDRLPALGRRLLDVKFKEGEIVSAWSMVPSLGKYDILVFDHGANHVVAHLVGHEDNSTAGDFDSTGNQLVTGDNRGVVRTWDLRSGTPLLNLDSGGASINNVSFSEDGLLVGSASMMSRELNLWDAESGEPVTVIENTSGLLALHPDGRHLATCHLNAARYLDLANSEDGVSLFGHTGDISCMALSPTSDVLATGGRYGSIRLWDVSVVDELKLFHLDSRMRSWDVGPGDRLLAMNRLEGIVEIRCGITGAILASITLDGEKSVIPTMAFSPSGNLLAVGHGDTFIIELDTGKIQQVIQSPEMHVYDMAFSPDASTLAIAMSDVATGDGVLFVHDVLTGKELYSIKDHEAWINAIDFHPDGTQFATASADNTIGIWDTVTGEQLVLLRGHERNVQDVEYSPDGLWIASASEDATVRIWETDTGEPLQVLTGHDETVHDVSFIRDGSRLLSSGYSSFLAWDPTNGELMAASRLAGDFEAIDGMTWGDSGHRGFFGHEGIQCIDLRSRAEILDERHRMIHLMTALSPLVDGWLKQGGDETVVSLMEKSLQGRSPEEQAAISNLVLEKLVARRNAAP